MTRIAVIDYGMGNLRSVAKALEHVGASVFVSSLSQEIFKADKIVLPGVGAISHGMANLQRTGLVSGLKQWLADDRPFLGICLGLQALFTMSDEGGAISCLDILPGRVVRFAPATGRKIPHMGWNTVRLVQEIPIFRGLPDNAFFYFVHSYYVAPEDAAIVAATTDYGSSFVSAVSRGNLFACQFHPEKSQRAGLKLLENFVGL